MLNPARGKHPEKRGDTNKRSRVSRRAGQRGAALGKTSGCGSFSPGGANAHPRARPPEHGTGSRCGVVCSRLRLLRQLLQAGLNEAREGRVRGKGGEGEGRCLHTRLYPPDHHPTTLTLYHFPSPGREHHRGVASVSRGCPPDYLPGVCWPENVAPRRAVNEALPRDRYLGEG